MPFLGQDWRSCGDQWVRTTKGWERLRWWRMKLFENLNENVIARFLKLNEVFQQQEIGVRQPHVMMAKNSKEMRMKVTLSEAFSQLDLSGGIRDIRRFNYICKILEILLSEKLHCISGSAQKLLFMLLEDIVQQVLRTDSNIHTAQNLISRAKNALGKWQYDHVGSTSLWERHKITITNLQMMIDKHQSTQRVSDGRMMISDLPADLVRQILQCLVDHRDIIHVGQTEWRAFDLSEEELIWQQLCLYHFANMDFSSVVRKDESLTNFSWKQLYARLAKRYGLKDNYAEMLHLCKNCNTLYWSLHGHPCQITAEEMKPIVVSPRMCVQMFCA